MRINTVKMSILPKAIYRINEIPIIMLMVFFTEIEKNPIICMEPQRPQTAKAILRKKKKKPKKQKKKLEVSHALISNYTTKLQ